jgi:hypothetical protein
MQKICNEYAKDMQIYAKNMQKYAPDMHLICNDICKKYAGICKNMQEYAYFAYFAYIYAPPTLLMGACARSCMARRFRYLRWIQVLFAS